MEKGKRWNDILGWAVFRGRMVWIVHLRGKGTGQVN